MVWLENFHVKASTNQQYWLGIKQYGWVLDLYKYLLCKRKKSTTGGRQALLTIQCILCAYISLAKSHISLIFHWEHQEHMSVQVMTCNFWKCILILAYWAVHEHEILIKSLYEGSLGNKRRRWLYCFSLHCNFYGTTLASLSVGQSGSFWENCLKKKGNWPVSAYPFCCQCSVSLHRENPVSSEPEDV